MGPEAAGEGAGRLEVLETGDPATSLRQLLSWSHGQLSAPAAAMFALLGVHCGPDITVPAAASLIGGRRAEAGRALAELAGASLAAEHRPGRYVLHDLVRGYAAGHAREDLGQAEIRAAVERSLDHYLYTMVIFSSDIPWIFTPAPPVPGVVPEQLADGGELQDWARAEHQVLLQAAAQAAAAGLVTRAWQIFECQAWFWAARGTGPTGGPPPGRAGRRRGRGRPHHPGLDPHAHRPVRHVHRRRGEDRIHLDRALDHFRRAGDLPGQAWAHLFAGLACTWTGDWAEAVTHGQPALSLFRQADDRAGEGLALAASGRLCSPGEPRSGA